MKYIYFEFDGEEFYLELDEESYAMRQIIFSSDGTYEISCFDDCLAEGRVECLNESSVQIISLEEFEGKWNSIINIYQERWSGIKKQYPIGKNVSGIVKYFYPHGAIIELSEAQGCFIGDKNTNLKRVNVEVSGIVSGYDDKNMWILLECPHEVMRFEKSYRK